MGDQMTVGSLFAGIGGFDLGFERAGFKTIWQVEIDEYCRRVLARHFPEAERFGDIRECGSHNLKPVDVICGGFPCQDISNAGKMAGIDGERSGLWREYARIISELRPRYVVVENVSALLVRGIERVLGDLAECGYDAEWQVIPACAVGAPHRRNRIWIIGYQQSVADPGRVRRLEHTGLTQAVQQSQQPGIQPQESQQSELSEPIHRGGADVADASCELSHRSGRARRRWTEPANGGSSVNVADTNSSGFSLAGNAGRIGEAPSSLETWAAINRRGWWATEPNVGRVAHGVPARVDRLKSLGNAVVPQIAQWIAERIKQAEQPRDMNFVGKGPGKCSSEDGCTKEKRDAQL